MNRVLRGETLPPLKPADPDGETASLPPPSEGERTKSGGGMDPFPPPAPRPAGA
jgi:hypothetical protein